MPAVTATSLTVAMATGKLLHPCIQRPASPRVLAATDCPRGRPLESPPARPVSPSLLADAPTQQICVSLFPLPPLERLPRSWHSSAAKLWPYGAADAKGLHRAQKALKFSEKIKDEELFHTEKPVTDSLRCKLLGDARVHQGSAAQSVGPNPSGKNISHFSCIFPRECGTGHGWSQKTVSDL